jgi:hypothetical protein
VMPAVPKDKAPGRTPAPMLEFAEKRGQDSFRSEKRGQDSFRGETHGGNAGYGVRPLTYL